MFEPVINQLHISIAYGIGFFWVCRVSVSWEQSLVSWRASELNHQHCCLTHQPLGVVDL
jgi:hypothetical protein